MTNSDLMKADSTHGLLSSHWLIDLYTLNAMTRQTSSRDEIFDKTASTSYNRGDLGKQLSDFDSQ